MSALTPRSNRTPAIAINLLDRKSRNTGEFELAADATQTVVADARVWANAVVHIKPQTSAAAALGVLLVVEGDGAFVVSHPSANTLRGFRYSIEGMLS